MGLDGWPLQLPVADSPKARCGRSETQNEETLGLGFKFWGLGGYYSQICHQNIYKSKFYHQNNSSTAIIKKMRQPE